LLASKYGLGYNDTEVCNVVMFLKLISCIGICSYPTENVRSRKPLYKVLSHTHTDFTYRTQEGGSFQDTGMKLFFQIHTSTSIEKHTKTSFLQ